MRDRINQSVKDAMKSGAKARLSTLRLMQAAIKDRDIAARVDTQGTATGRDRIEEHEIFALLQKMIKQRRESAESFRLGNREELADKEISEIGVIEEFLPKQLSTAETEKAVDEAMAEMGCCGLKDMGKTIGLLKERHTGQMDFGKASAIIKQKLK